MDDGPRSDADMRGGADPDGRPAAGNGQRYAGGRTAGARLAGRTPPGASGDDHDGDRTADLRSAAVRNWLNAHAMVATATAGRDDRNEHSWWRRHHHFGWLGPLFWPFASYDADDYATSGYGDDRAFWDHDYKDIYARIFPGYDRDDQAGDLPPDEATVPERQTPRAPADPARSPAAADLARPQTTARPATPLATARQIAPKAAPRPATPQVAAQPIAPQAAPPPVASQAAPQPTARQAIAQPATPQAAAQPTARQATAQPATPQATAQPTAPQAIAQPPAPQATAQPAVPQAMAQPATSKAIRPSPNRLAQLCADDSRDITGLPIDQIQRTVAPNPAQLAALDELGNASMKAAQNIRAACPTQVAAAAPGRLAAMQQRIETMIAAVLTVRPALDKFYGLLDDGQKTRLNGIGPSQPSQMAAARSAASLVQNCGSVRAGATDWPIAEIEAKLQLTAAQHESLTALVDASAKASDMFQEACQSGAMLTPPARLAAIGNRLDVMLLAIKIVHTALDDFYGRLTEEQKAQFETIGPAGPGPLGSAAPASPAEANAQRAAPARRQVPRPRASVGGGTI